MSVKQAVDILRIITGIGKLFRHRVCWSNPSDFVDRIDFGKQDNWEWLAIELR